MSTMLVALTLVAAPAWQAPGENLALERPYTVSPAPSYALCRDPDDATQLTDGEYVEGYFWVQRGCVGWQSISAALIIIDLGEPRPIGGALVSTAAGVAGVTWPSAIQILVSDDQQTWFPAGELRTLGDAAHPPPAEGYANHQFRTDRLAARGRYVAVGLVSSGPYVFCDEIEIYRGPDALLADPRTGLGLGDPLRWIADQRLATEVRVQVTATVARVRELIDRSPLDAGGQAAVAAMLPPEIPAAVPALERAILPMTPAHTAAFFAQAELWRRLGRPPLTVWRTGRWEPLSPTLIPPEPGPLNLSFTQMRGEVRAETVVLASAAEAPLPLRVSVDGVPGLTVQLVEWTATALGPPVASALVPAADRSVLPGLPQQLWLRLDSRGVEAGVYRGTVQISVGEQTVELPVEADIAPLEMPAEPTLSLGGWDYTDAPGRGITAENLDDTVAFLRAYGVNAPWATSQVMPFGEHDADGAMIREPDTAAMDTWLDRWPGARWYCVFNSFAEPVPDTPAGRRRVAEWIEFWTEHLADRGIAAEQLCLLLADEPHDQALSDLIVSYARVIQETAPEVVIWNDPTFTQPTQAPAALLAASDVICPNRTQWQANRAEFDQVYLAQRAAGRQLSLYSCSGPMRNLDPYAYCLLQAWEAFRVGSQQSFFWSFCDSGAGNAWLEIGGGQTCFSPQFLDARGNTPSKQLEAMRESVFDYEYLVMLRAAGAGDLADELVRQVLAADGADAIDWTVPKDRNATESARLRALARLRQER